MRYEFDKFTLDDVDELLFDGQIRIPLDEKAFRVLLQLVRSSPTTVRKNDLLDAAWGAHDLEAVVRNLYQAIVRLRHALGDVSKRIIETVREHPSGYRIAGVKKSHQHNISDDVGPMREADWVNRLNRIDDVRAYGLVERLPEVDLDGWYQVDKRYSRAIQKRSEELSFDSCQAVVAVEPNIRYSTSVRLRAHNLKYSAVSVLRDEHRNPLVLSANAVLICREKRCLILNLRSQNAGTYQNHLHTIGGAFDLRDRNLKRTAMREIFEEANIMITIDKKTPMLLAMETSTRFLQLVFLGVNISADQYADLHESWESKEIVPVPFDDLRMVLKTGLPTIGIDGKPSTVAWVPTGKAHVLAWLACGAPGVNESELFAGLSPFQLFEHAA